MFQIEQYIVSYYNYDEKVFTQVIVYAQFKLHYKLFVYL